MLIKKYQLLSIDIIHLIFVVSHSGIYVFSSKYNGKFLYDDGSFLFQLRETP